MGTLKTYKQISEKEKESDVKNIIEKTKVIIRYRVYSILWARNAFKIPI